MGNWIEMVTSEDDILNKFVLLPFGTTELAVLNGRDTTWVGGYNSTDGCFPDSDKETV